MIRGVWWAKEHTSVARSWIKLHNNWQESIKDRVSCTDNTELIEVFFFFFPISVNCKPERANEIQNTLCRKIRFLLWVTFQNEIPLRAAASCLGCMHLSFPLIYGGVRRPRLSMIIQPTFCWRCLARGKKGRRNSVSHRTQALSQ